MSDLIVNGPGKVARKSRQKQTIAPIEFSAPEGAIDPQTALNKQIEAVESSKRTLGYNVASSLTQAEQRGFATGLQQGLQDGAASSASFFANCISSAGGSLL